MATSESDPIATSVDALRDRARTFDIRESLLIGAGAMIGTYVLTLILFVSTAETIDFGLGKMLNYVGFLVYSAHHVPAVGDGTSILELQGSDISTVKLWAYLVIPMAMSLLAGGVAALRNGRRDGAPEDALFAALSVAGGYAAVSVIGSLIAQFTSAGGVVVTPHTPLAGVYGLAYPLGFGLLAAAILQFARYLTVRVDAEE